MATYSLKNMSTEDKPSGTPSLEGYKGVWCSYRHTNGLRMVKTDGNHCTNWVSKIIAYVSAFFNS